MKRAFVVMLAVWGCTRSSNVADAGSDVPMTDIAPDNLDAQSIWDGGPRFTDTNPQKLDLLIITEEDTMRQALLRAAIPWLTRGIAEAGAIDIRVGVIGSDLGDPAGAVCEVPTEAGGQLIACVDGEPGLFFDPSEMTRDQITSEMRCRLPESSSTLPGIRECALAQTFDAMVAAISPNRTPLNLNTPVAHGDGRNEAFFRRDGYLAILSLTTPDDCTPEDIEFTTSERYEGDNALQRCLLNHEALRAVDGVVDRLLAVRGLDTVGVYAVTNMPSELSGERPDVVLADRRMAPGLLLDQPIALSLSAGWDPESPIMATNFRVGTGRRIVELLSALSRRGVHTGAFSYQGETALSGQPAFEEAVAPLVARILAGLRQPR